MIDNKREAQPIKRMVNESKYAESLINAYKDNKLDRKVYTSAYEIKALAKYYRHSEELKPQKIASELNEFCQKRYVDYNKDIFFSQIKQVVAFSLNHALNDKTSIGIAKSEMDSIWNVQISGKKEKEKVQRILFYMLIQAKALKASNSYIGKNKGDEYYLNLKYSKIISQSGVDIRSADEKAKYVKLFCDTGLVELDGEKKKFKVNFVDIIGKPIIEIVHFHTEAMKLYWDKYLCENNKTVEARMKIVNEYGLCSNCSLPIVIKSNRKIYCEICGKKRAKAAKKTWKLNNEKGEF